MNQTTQKSKSRMANLELLRCIAMMMVVVLHFLGKGELLGDVTVSPMEGTGIAAWILEVFCIVAVNIYMLISGYFLCESSFKLSRLLELVLQVWFYSVGAGLVAAVCGLVPDQKLGINYYVTLLCPISMGHYWFLTAYFFMYLLIPFLATAVRGMSKRQLQVVLGLFLLVFCLTKSILPLRLEMDEKGYDCLWYVCVFLMAAYLRRFGGDVTKKRLLYVGLYIFGCIAMFGELMLLHLLYVRTGRMGYLLTVSIEYNHVFPFLASVGLFAAFLSVKLTGKAAKIVCRVAPYTLGVYLLHENIGVRSVWPKWFRAEYIDSTGELLLWTALAVGAVFVIGILVDMLRKTLMGFLHRGLSHIPLYRRLAESIRQIDNSFRRNQ